MVTHTYVDLEIEEARHLANLVGIEYDLKTTIEWCDHFHQIDPNQDMFWAIEPMTTAIIIRFMRAFGSGKRTPNARHILSILSNEEKAQYEFFKNVRDKHVAHSANEFEHNQVKAYYVEGEEDKGVNSIGHGCDRVIGLSSNEVTNIHKICNKLLAEIKSEMQSEKKKLLSITNEYTKDDILKFTMRTSKNPKDIDVSNDRR